MKRDATGNVSAVNIEVAPALLERIRLYADPFVRHPPAIFSHFPGGSDPVFPFEPDSDRGLGVLLLVAALYQPGGEAVAARVVAGLYRDFGNDIFRLNRLPFESLNHSAAALAIGFDDASRNRIPGILRSVCDFFYRIGPLRAWLDSATDWEIRAGELCNEIYWMGASSRTRTKARLFFWLACQIPGFGAKHPQAETFTWPIGDGHMRFRIDIVKPVPVRRAGGRSPEERLAAFAAFARDVFPGEPWRLFAPLDAFLKHDGRGSHACRTVQGGCRPCPLASFCPASAHFMKAEG